MEKEYFMILNPLENFQERQSREIPKRIQELKDYTEKEIDKAVKKNQTSLEIDLSNFDNLQPCEDTLQNLIWFYHYQGYTVEAVPEKKIVALSWEKRF